MLGTVLAACLVIGAEPPAPTFEPAAEGPVEGPARPPAEPERASPTEDPSEGESLGSIELAVPPPETPAPGEAQTPGPGQVSVEEAQVWWPDPGRAPPDGAGMFVTAGVTIPAAAVVTWGLLLDSSLSEVDRTGVVVAGAGMGVLGLVGLGMGIQRRMKLVRWANAYRVVPTPQGGGLLAAGGLGLTTGLTLVPLGAWILARGGITTTGWTLLGIGAVAGGLVAPLGIVFGSSRRRSWQATGGWKRRPIPPLSPSAGWIPGGATLGLRGRF